ncbi:MAG: CPBP family intramembrane metalloprotease [Desulfobacteraceae bacterium]|nr:CPBP family intramembrane metalloprotease [Desulfobacteraceae bacterium]MBC2751477.1 CPBP family intramembrane metalloprotease [Desulfobacteraceae bacterium]
MANQTSRSQLVLFVVVSYSILWFLFVIGKFFEIPFTYDPRKLGGLLVLAGVPASSIGAAIAVLMVNGSGGLHQLLKRSFQWRFNPIWYIAAISTPLLIAAASTITSIWIADIETPNNWFAPSMPLGVMVFILIYDGLGEEIGWRGFALPELQKRLGSLGGSIMVGILWALWHLPLFFTPGSNQYGDSLIPYLYVLTCWTIVMALFVGKARGSILPGILIHESANFVSFAFHYPRHYVLFFWGIAALIAIVFLPKPLIKFGNNAEANP